MSDDERIVLRLSPDTVAVYRALVSRGEFRSINDAVRSVLDGYASERLAQGVRPAPEHGDDALSIEDLTIDGSTLDSAVRSAARDYVPKEKKPISGGETASFLKKFSKNSSYKGVSP